MAQQQLSFSAWTPPLIETGAQGHILAQYHVDDPKNEVMTSHHAEEYMAEGSEIRSLCDERRTYDAPGCFVEYWKQGDMLAGQGIAVGQVKMTAATHHYGLSFAGVGIGHKEYVLADQTPAPAPGAGKDFWPAMLFLLAAADAEEAAR